MKYDDKWAGRYYNEASTTIGFTFMPSVSYRITKRLSVGAGLNATYAAMKEKAAVKNFDRPDGQITAEDNKWGYGADVGVWRNLSKEPASGLITFPR